MGKETYDCIIVGCGPAGLGAALYGARDRFKTLVLEKFYPGGQIMTTDRIENYPGFEKISGPDLVEQLMSQVKQFGAEIKTSSEVTSVARLDDGRLQVDCDEDSYVARVVILASGSSYRKLGVPGEEEFRSAGVGVSYCGTCDAPFFKDKKVVAVGGGNVAVEDTLHITRFASEVTLVHRRDEFRATQVLVEELMDKVNEPGSNLKLKLDTVVTAIEGAGKVESVKLKNVKTSYLRTAVPGVFVAGDCRIGAAMQLATAVGDGVLAAVMMKQYFRDAAWWNESVSDALLPGGR